MLKQFLTFFVAYIDSSLVGTGTVDKAAIYSKAGDSTWAISPGFQVHPPDSQVADWQLSAPEVTAICKGFDNSEALFGRGIKIGGEKYFTIRADDKAIQGRKVRLPLPSPFVAQGRLVQGEEGIICVRTKQAVIVAHYPAGQQAGEVTKVVLALSDYLTNLGY